MKKCEAEGKIKTTEDINNYKKQLVEIKTLEKELKKNERKEAKEKRREERRKKREERINPSTSTSTSKKKEKDDTKSSKTKKESDLDVNRPNKKEEDSNRATNYLVNKLVDRIDKGSIEELFKLFDEFYFRSSSGNQIPQELGQLKQLLETIRSREDVEYGYKEIVEILHFISS